MPTYTAPVRDMQFLLHDVLDIGSLNDLDPFREATADVIDAILEEGGRFASEVLQPLNQSGDAEGCTFRDGEVTAPKGFRDAYALYVENGWQGLTVPEEWGGQGLPQVLGLAISEMAVASNWGFAMYPGLTKAAIEALLAHGSDDLKKTYLPRMVTGEWSGTMNLTEPHCGTDLGLIRTTAEPAEDGSYRITGTKIFISAGEHDLSANIIHLVLAKIPGGPDGTRGISLFVVPKFLPEENGDPGKRNGVACGSLEHKMGIHSNATCVMNYDNAVGFLVGGEHQGMRNMFTMMNEARLGVGLQGLAIADVAYQNAVTYARERLQGRALTGPKNPDGPADPIIVHPDVRRMLMTVRAFTESARALVLWTGVQIDVGHADADADVRQRAQDLVALLTPVIKSYMTDQGVEAANLAMKCYGGHGYIREWGMEQFVRDAIIATIYEGTNGVQAMDLIGRKLPANGGRAVMALFGMIREFIKETSEDDAMTPFTGPLKDASKRLQQASEWLMKNATDNPEHGGAAAHDYLNLMALVAHGYMWCLMARTAARKLATGNGNRDFLEAKLATARFFMSHVMPATATHLARIEAGAEPVMALDAEAF
ncbi:MAG: acyl-CoA dehydrogenase C-terminal domain-containing protein [Sphingomonadales bacterium]